MYFKYPNGFYVNNRLEDDGYKFKSIEDLISYVTRYCSKPVIAETRILKFDGENVTWYYTDHTHEQYHEVTESATIFISKLLQHLLPTHFKSIRHFGFYNKSDKIDNDTNMVIKKEKIPFIRSLLKWKDSILTSFHRIPIKCPKCGYEKLIARETIQSLEPNTFKDNVIFKCQNCNIRMEPITIEVDY